MANFVFWADTGVLVSLKSFLRNGEGERGFHYYCRSFREQPGVAG